MQILNLPIESPHFSILTEIEGVGSNVTSIEVYDRIYNIVTMKTR